MRFLIVFVGALVLLAAFSGSVAADDAKKPAETTPAQKPVAPEKAEAPKVDKAAIFSVWVIETEGEIKEGSLDLSKPGRYAQTTWDKDGSGGSIKGACVIDTTVEPMRIVEYIGDDPKAAGAEFMAAHGIFRFLDDGRLEIQWSPDEKYPKAFLEKPKKQTMFLHRAEKKE